MDEVVHEQKLIMTTGLVLILVSIVISFILSSLGCLILLAAIALTLYMSSHLAIRNKSIGNLVRTFTPPKTKWCTKIEYDHILVPADVDESLERFYERILSEHVNSWYGELSTDEEFLQELRHDIRDITSELLSRLARLDISELILRDLSQAAVEHLDCYLWARQHRETLPAEVSLHTTWLAVTGEALHPALTGRFHHTQYIENIAERIVPLLIKTKLYQSRVSSSILTSILANVVLEPLLDLVCEPRIINKLLLLWFSPEPVRIFTSCPDPPVRLLLKFVHAHSQPKPSSLHVDLSAILKDTNLLYMFLQYLKKNGGVNLLQFCLAVEDFNKRMMVVDLPEEELIVLHKNAKDLYDTYIKLGSVNFIKFDDDIIRDVGNIINQGHKNIQKLRTTPPLFRAYEQVYNNLEDNLCPQFYTSDEYLKLVLGNRLTDCRPDMKMRDEDSSKTKKDSWLSVINPFKKLSSGGSLSNQSTFYCSQDMEDLHSERDIEELLHPDRIIRNNNYVKSASSSILNQLDSSNEGGGGGGSVGAGSDSGIGSHKELSRSLDCLDIVPMPSSREHLMVGDQRRKSQTLPSFPSPNLSQIKKLSLGSAFGTKNLGLGRKFSSLIPTSSERFASTKHLKGKLNKLKTEVLGSGPLEGSPEPDTGSMDSAYDMTAASCDPEDEGVLKDVECRDLSAWRISIPRLEPRNDVISGKACFVFIIQVQRIDVTSEKDGEDLEWIVERQYQEFYSLQTALVQYHGVFEDVKLPPRSKMFGGKGLDVLQSKIEPFQDFLVKLLQKPNLKKSDLLFTFLTTRQEFNESSSQKFRRGVSIKLTKERGQFLQSFINVYKGSTQNPPPKPGKLPWDEDLETPTDQPSQGDNFPELDEMKSLSLGPSQQCSVEGMYDVLQYLAMRLCRLPHSWLQFISSLRWLLADSLNHLLHFLLASKLDKMLNSGRVAYLISVIEESLFEPPAPRLSEEEQRREAEATLTAFREYLPAPVRIVLGQRFYSSTEIIYSALQDPRLNKQLAFNLLEVVAGRIFPELKL